MTKKQHIEGGIESRPLEEVVQENEMLRRQVTDLSRYLTEQERLTKEAIREGRIYLKLAHDQFDVNEEIVLENETLHKQTITLLDRLEQIVITKNAYRRLAHEDEKTRVLNSRGFDYQMRKINDGYSIILFDIDNFKQHNHVHGYVNADRILAQFAKLIINETRANDILCRFGGEEFLLVLPSCLLGEGVEKAEEIRKIIENYNFGDVMASRSRENPNVTTCAGVAYAPFKTQSLTAFQQANEFLNYAKAHGRNQVGNLTSSRAFGFSYATQNEPGLVTFQEENLSSCRD
jgi:diguanylate cyclase (GGDEF)-like protein